MIVGGGDQCWHHIFREVPQYLGTLDHRPGYPPLQFLLQQFLPPGIHLLLAHQSRPGRPLRQFHVDQDLVPHLAHPILRNLL